MSHARRRSISSSSSSSSDDQHSRDRKQNIRANKEFGDWDRAWAAPAIPSVQDPTTLQRGLQSQSQYSNMSGPGFPSSPPPYGGENQQFIGMPNEQQYAPPPGPPPSFPNFPSAEQHLGQPEQNRGLHFPGFPSTHHSSAPGHPSPTTPSHSHSAPPPSGFRVPLTSTAAFPTTQAGLPVAYDADGRSPIFLGSALLEKSVHPCKIAPALTPPCRVPYGGRETEHQGRYDLLPFDPNSMEWVHTSQGRLPPGHRPVEGGYEDYGSKLYHAMGVVNGIKVPGKTGEHLVSVITAVLKD